MPPFDNQFTHSDGFHFILGKLPCLVKKGLPCREYALVAGKFGKILVASSSAQEWYGNHNMILALKNAHLDLEFFDMLQTEDFEGLLPELWGFRRMSNLTIAMLTDSCNADPVSIS